MGRRGIQPVQWRRLPLVPEIAVFKLPRKTFVLNPNPRVSPAASRIQSNRAMSPTLNSAQSPLATAGCTETPDIAIGNPLSQGQVVRPVIFPHSVRLLMLHYPNLLLTSLSGLSPPLASRRPSEIASRLAIPISRN